MVMGRYKISYFEAVLTVLGSGIILFILAPLIHIILATSLNELNEVAVDREVLESIKLTLTAAFFSTLASAVLGIPLAYLLARKKFFGRMVLLSIIDLPVIIPHSAAGIALLSIIGRQSILGRVLGESLIGTAAGISVAMAFVSVPFLINAARQAFAAVPESLEKAARTLGARPWYVFFTISLPLAWRGILSGMILMWARGISEFGAVVIIAYHPMTTPVMVFQRFNDFGLRYARSVAVLLILICVGLFLLFRLLNDFKRRESGNA